MPWSSAEGVPEPPKTVILVVPWAASGVILAFTILGVIFALVCIVLTIALWKRRYNTLLERRFSNCALQCFAVVMQPHTRPTTVHHVSYGSSIFSHCMMVQDRCVPSLSPFKHWVSFLPHIPFLHAALASSCHALLFHPHPLPREMKLTSPRLNLVIAVGAIIWYISVVVKAMPTEDTTTATVLCEVRRHTEFTVRSGSEICGFLQMPSLNLQLYQLWFKWCGHGLQLLHPNRAISVSYMFHSYTETHSWNSTPMQHYYIMTIVM